MQRPVETRQRVVLVTGAAGGLGRALVSTFAIQGWRVIAGWHSEPPNPPLGPRNSVWSVRLDVTSRASVDEVLSSTADQVGPVEVLINNAGVTADALLVGMDEGAWDDAIEVNLRGAFLMCRAVLPGMADARRGHIVNVASYSARHGARGQANYAAAKAGLLGLTQALAREAGHRNVRVNAVLPGFLETPMTAAVPRPVLEAAQAANVLGRFNTVGEVARFIAFLATLDGVSGQLFQLDSRIGRWA